MFILLPAQSAPPTSSTSSSLAFARARASSSSSVRLFSAPRSPPPTFGRVLRFRVWVYCEATRRSQPRHCDTGCRALPGPWHTGAGTRDRARHNIRLLYVCMCVCAPTGSVAECVLHRRVVVSAHATCPRRHCRPPHRWHAILVLDARRTPRRHPPRKPMHQAQTSR